jgi:DNA-binding NtrC family response regulator
MAESKTETQVETLLNEHERFRCKVLHVDDDPAFLKIAKECLEMQGGFQVEAAGCVEEAMDKLGKEEYDAIVSDYQMPGKNGLEFLKELRDEGNDIPFIIFTGKGKEELAVKALNLGADGYFDKHGDAETVYCELAHGILLVVEKRKAKMKALSEEERLRAVLSSSPDAITVSDLNGNIVDCNEAAVKLAGISSKESIIGKNSFEFISEKDRKRALENLKKTIEQGITKNTVYSLFED